MAKRIQDCAMRAYHIHYTVDKCESHTCVITARSINAAKDEMESRLNDDLALLNQVKNLLGEPLSTGYTYEIIKVRG